MFEGFYRFITRPVNSLTYKELVLHSFVGCSIILIVALPCAFFISLLIGGGFDLLAIVVFILSIAGFLFYVFKPIFERWIRFESDFGEDKYYYEASVFQLCFAGFMFTILMVTVFFIVGLPFIVLVGLGLSFFFPFLVVFLRRDYLYNENGALEVANDYEFAYNINMLLTGALFFSFSTLPVGFITLYQSIVDGWPSLWLSMLLICFQTIIFYCYLFPDFWNKYLPFDVKESMDSYVATVGVGIVIINIMVVKLLGLI